MMEGISTCTDVFVPNLLDYFPDNLSQIVEYDEPYLIKYEEGGVFKRHRDMKIMPEHIGVLLIYPPCEYTGGELVIYDSEGKIKHKISSSRNTQVVLISLEDEHEVFPVISGTRFVYLAPVFSKIKT